ncbi:MAG: hypothetical protein Q8L29_02450 [archaeon]|nr:hypothetical protein [archaeon]
MEEYQTEVISTLREPLQIYDYFNVRALANSNSELVLTLGKVRESIVREPNKNLQYLMVVAHIRKYSSQDRSGKAREIHIKLKSVLDGLIG